MIGRVGRRLWPLLAFALSVSALKGLSTQLGQPLAPWAAEALPVLCPLRRLLDLPCPTCGLGRALLAAWSFDLPASAAYHPLGPVILLTCALGSLCWLASPSQTRAALNALRQLAIRRPQLIAIAWLGYGLLGFGRHFIDLH